MREDVNMRGLTQTVANRVGAMFESDPYLARSIGHNLEVVEVSHNGKIPGIKPLADLGTLVNIAGCLLSMSGNLSPFGHEALQVNDTHGGDDKVITTIMLGRDRDTHCC